MTNTVYKRLLVLISILIAATATIYIYQNPTQLTYIGYGISITYPSSMKLSVGDVEGIPTSKTTGALHLIDNHHPVTVGWAPLASGWTAKEAVNASVGMIIKSVKQKYSDCDVKDLGVDEVFTRADGSNAIIRRFSFVADGDLNRGVIAWWLDERSNKVICLTVMSTAPDETKGRFDSLFNGLFTSISIDG